MVKSFQPSMFNKGSGVCDDSTSRTADVGVDFKYFLDGLRDYEGGL